MFASSASAQSTFTSQLPVKARKGATVVGVVEADGKPLQGVVVSDGYEVTTTDKKGCYYLDSAKKNGNVFITIPSGYEVNAENAMPQYWAALTAPATETERHDFALKAVENDKHAIMAITDIHLSNQMEDLKQFNGKFMPRLNEEIAKYRSQGIPVYTICMGDSSFDMFWYDFLYEIEDFRATLRDSEYPTPVFHAMGNHDNDGATPADADTDFNATEKYRKAFGPTYYSFNIGGIHYVMLDNVVYHNEKSPSMKKFKGIYGARNYDRYVSDEQMEWLKKDLAFVADKNTPIVIGMHCPVYRYKNLMDGKVETRFSVPEKATELSEILKDFKQVHFVTGHNHKNNTSYGKDDPSQPLIANTVDHNIGAVCGAWWFTGAHGGLTLSKEGTPAGFEVFTADGQNLEWYYTTVDDGADKQFRSFDLNRVREYFRTDPEVRVFFDHYPKRQNYANVKDNRVMINVWAWEPTWKISVKENGRELAVERKKAENPLAILSYFIPKTVWNRDFPAKYGNRVKTPHMFFVTASAPDSTLEITVTDTFGKEYKEIMIRPKEFSKTMK